MQEALFLTSEACLQPSDAVAAIIVDPEGRYVVQRRDDLATIFFPGHWGCFGGAIEEGEPPPDAMRRELREELELAVGADQLKFFTRFDFDFAPLGGAKVYRMYYEIRITGPQVAALRLHEGQSLQHFDGQKLLLQKRVTPYDSFAIWMHSRATRRSATQWSR
jgi:8-oxo-dGTP pyrophosphatase MutT (NUDIX family)